MVARDLRPLRYENIHATGFTEGGGAAMKTTSDMPDRRFQAHFEPRQRGHIANAFLSPVRNGETEPHRVVSAVRHDLLAQAVKWKRWGNYPEGRKRNEQIVSLIDAYFDEAVDLARYYLWWEGLSEPEKRHMKAERWMAQQLPTEKQVKYLRSLGYTGQIESKLQASELIDKLLKEGRTFV